MANIPDAALHEMLAQLPQNQQRAYAHIVSGKISHQVHCDSDICQGEVVAYIYVDGADAKGKIQYRVEPVIKDNISLTPGRSQPATMKLRSSRLRLDGQYGFECSCGNDSRLAEHERASIGYDGKPPTRQGLEDIYTQLKKRPTNYPEIDGVRHVDGFRIERLAA